MTRAAPRNKPDGRKARASERRNRRRAQIRAAARRVFSGRGYHATSVADILAEAGIARGTFYLYYASKRLVFEELLDDMFEQIAGAVRRVELGPDAAPPLEQMYGNVHRVIEVLEDNRELTIILLREAVGLDEEFDQKLDAFYSRLADVIEGAIGLGQQMGLVRPCRSRLVASCVLGSVKETMLRVLCSTDERERIDRDELARELLDYNLRGLFVGSSMP